MMHAFQWGGGRGGGRARASGKGGLLSPSHLEVRSAAVIEKKVAAACMRRRVWPGATTRQAVKAVKTVKGVKAVSSPPALPYTR